MKNGDNRMKKLTTAIALIFGAVSTSAFAQDAAFKANTSANASTSASLSLNSNATTQPSTQVSSQTSSQGEVTQPLRLTRAS